MKMYFFSLVVKGFILGLFFLSACSWAKKETIKSEFTYLCHDKTNVPDNLPLDIKGLKRCKRITNPRSIFLKYPGIKTTLSIETVENAVSGSKEGIVVDLTKIRRLLDGTLIKGYNIYGNIYYGPYPFSGAEGGMPTSRFVCHTTLKHGKAVIDVSELFSREFNSENWNDTGKIIIRFELFYRKKFLGFYDIFRAFKKSDTDVEILPWISRGPFISCLTSDNYSSVKIYFKTNIETIAYVILNTGEEFSDTPTRNHEISITNLLSATRYTYKIRIGTLESREYTFTTAPQKGKGEFTFAVCGDSRNPPGGGMNNYLRTNMNSLRKLGTIAYNNGARFILFLGDMSDGYSMDVRDLETQWTGFKESLQPFWVSAPVYTCPGNHECLYSAFRHRKDNRRVIEEFDQWPYDEFSVEKIFANNFYNPENAPIPSDTRRPSYTETVYSFMYGSVKFIILNNTYWWSVHPENFGGCTTGYIMEDQIEWFESQLQEAESDSSVKYIFVCMHCPPFPCDESNEMFCNGNNNLRAWTYSDGSLVPSKYGIIEIRNRLAEAVSKSSKTVAVLASHEHCYAKMLIDGNVPIGIPEIDDKNGDGIIDQQEGESLSPDNNIIASKYYIITGGAGAHYSASHNSTWVNWLKEHDSGNKNFYFSPKEHILIFTVSGAGIKMSAIGINEEVIDRIMDF